MFEVEIGNETGSLLYLSGEHVPFMKKFSSFSLISRYTIYRIFRGIRYSVDHIQEYGHNWRAFPGLWSEDLSIFCSNCKHLLTTLLSLKFIFLF